MIATASEQHHDFVHQLGAAVVLDHGRQDWPEQVRELTDGGAQLVLACAAPTLAGAARAARDGALIATPVLADGFPDSDRVRWQQYSGQPRGSDLIAMAPWFDAAALSVQIAGRYYWKNAAAAHREIEKGHVSGKLLLVVDDDLAAELGV